MKTIWIVLTALFLMLSVSVASGKFINSRSPWAAWEAPDEQDVVAFDLRIQIGTAEEDTLKLFGTEVYDACVNGYVPPNVTCMARFTVSADGPLKVAVRTVDAANNVSVWDSTSVIVDTIPPKGCSGIRVQ